MRIKPFKFGENRRQLWKFKDLQKRRWTTRNRRIPHSSFFVLNELERLPMLEGTHEKQDWWTPFFHT